MCEIANSSDCSSCINFVFTNYTCMKCDFLTTFTLCNKCLLYSFVNESCVKCTNLQDEIACSSCHDFAFDKNTNLCFNCT